MGIWSNDTVKICLYEKVEPLKYTICPLSSGMKIKGYLPVAFFKIFGYAENCLP